MRDWKAELLPGTLLCRKSDKVFALVISLNVQYMPNWVQLYIVLLTNKGELLDLSIESGTFFNHWLKVLT